jgi:3-methyladenine DNA glycosylase AlkD
LTAVSSEATIVVARRRETGHRSREDEMTDPDVESVLEQLAALEDARAREVNERHGDDHGVNLTKLRAVAKSLRTDHDLARRLWATGDTAARLVALLICRPKSFGAAELDAMLREARAPKVVDWLVNYVVKKSGHAEELRVAWLADPDPVVAGAGWALTADDVAKRPELLDLPGLLGTIEEEMKAAPGRKQWEMNSCLAAIGIHHPDQRARAVDIGERLQVLKDYPTPPGCTSPYAPIWIGEMVSRRGAA